MVDFVLVPLKCSHQFVIQGTRIIKQLDKQGSIFAREDNNPLTVNNFVSLLQCGLNQELV